MPPASPSIDLPALTECRLCGSERLTPVLDLGLRHMVDFPRTPDGLSKPPLPLEIVQCRICTLVQLRHTAPSDWRYSTYYYRSGTNEVMREELADVVAAVKATVPISRQDVVLDIGANDGTLLAAYAGEGITPLRLAVEPAANLQEAVRKHSEIQFNKTWPLEKATIGPGSCKAVTSIAMMYGADDLNAFVAEVKRVLHPKGVWVVQFQDLLSVLQSVAIDWFVHEHLATFSLWSFLQLCDAHGLQIQAVERRAINGGSLRVIVRHKHTARPEPSVNAQLERERQYGLLVPEQGFGTFLARVTLVQTALRSMVEEITRKAGVVDLYACSTKASLLLQLVGLDKTLIRQGIERQSEKVGRYVGASGIPIVSEEEARRDPATAWLVGAYQFRDQFIRREEEYLSKGGLLIVPLPMPEVVTMRRSA